MSRMTDLQIYAAIKGCQATAEKYEKAGRRGDAAAARRREARLRMELKERIDFAIAHNQPLTETFRSAVRVLGVLA